MRTITLPQRAPATLPASGRTTIGSDDYALVWRSGPRLGLVVSFVEISNLRRDDVRTEIGRLAPQAPEADRRAFWQAARAVLADVFPDEEHYGDLREEAERALAELVPEPEPLPLAGGAEAFVAWRADASEQVEELRYFLFDAEPPLLAVARWLTSAPPEVGAWLGRLYEALDANWRQKPYPPADWLNWPDRPGEYLHANLDIGVKKGVLSAADAARVAALNALRRAEVVAERASYPAERATWLDRHTRMIRDLTARAPAAVRAWLEANPPPSDEGVARGD